VGDELFQLLGTDAHDARVRAAVEDAADAERLVDTLVEMRAEQGITQADLAGRMQTTQSAVSKFERAGGDPRLSTLQRYARAVNARLRWVVSTSAQEGDIWQEASYPVPVGEEAEAPAVDEGVATPLFKLAS
jgi:transcriptional regulator with XRE-family HTH domain